LFDSGGEVHVFAPGAPPGAHFTIYGESSSLGFKGFYGNIEGFKPEYFTRHIDEEGHKHAGGFVSTKIANVAVLRPMDVCTNVITPETHAQLKA